MSVSSAIVRIHDTDDFSRKKHLGVSRRSSFFPTSRAHLAPPLFRLFSPKKQGQGKLGFAMAILFSPLLAVAGLSVQTLLRVIPQAAEGKDFFPKDSMDF